LEIKARNLKKLLKNYKLYKEGYKREDIIFQLMGRNLYDDMMLDSYMDFIPVYNLV
jgi:hypothetical protein